MSKKEQIQDAALQLLVENGIHATPMSKIAKAAKTGMGTIYNYFESKEVLVNALYVFIKEKEKEAIEEAWQQGTPVKVQFERYYEAAIRFFLENPLYFRFIYQYHPSPLITKESREVGYMAMNRIFELINKGKKEQIIKNIDNNLLLQFIGGTTTSYLRSLLHHEQPLLLDKSLGHQLTMAWDAIKA